LLVWPPAVTVTEWLPLGAVEATLKLALMLVLLAELMLTVMPLAALTDGLVPNP